MDARRFPSWIWVVGLVAGPTAAPGLTRHVPSEYATIQAAVDASAAGDSVLVAPGTYTDFEIREVDGGLWTACVFVKDGVVLKSESGPAVTVIDGHLINGPQRMVINAVHISLVETLVEGFTVTLAPSGVRGAYLLGRLSFRDCVFRDLDVNPSSGGGIAANGDLTLVGCTFENCRGIGGGAIYHANGWIEMYDTVVRNCGNIGVNVAGNGVPPLESVYIDGCTFEDCWNTSAGGGALGATQTWGGFTVRNCRFENNEAASSGGGAVSLGFLPPTALIEDCLFLNNRAVGPNGIGGGVKAGGPVTVRRCTFWGNFAPTVSGGSAVQFREAGSALENNVIAGSLGQGGAVYAYNIPLTSTCNVFWQNEGGLGVYYTPGPTDRILDPLFCDVASGDFTVREDSPCIPPGSLDCGQIGAFGEGCGDISTETWSWGRIKGAYRVPQGDGK